MGRAARALRRSWHVLGELICKSRFDLVVVATSRGARACTALLRHQHCGSAVFEPQIRGQVHVISGRRLSEPDMKAQHCHELAISAQRFLIHFHNSCERSNEGMKFFLVVLMKEFDGLLDG